MRRIRRLYTLLESDPLFSAANPYIPRLNTQNIFTENQVINGNVTSDSITLTGLDAQGTPITAVMNFSQEWGVPQITLPGGITGQFFEELFFHGKALGDIRNGWPVMFAGTQGGHILIAETDKDILNTTPRFFLGIATQDITNGEFGKITCFGYVNDIPTTGWYTQSSTATTLYVQTNDLGWNSLTVIPPTAPHAKIVAAVITKHSTGGSNNGRILVRPEFGARLASLHDVHLTNIAEKETILWNASMSRFENRIPMAFDFKNISAPISGNLTLDNWTDYFLGTLTNAHNFTIVLGSPNTTNIVEQKILFKVGETLPIITHPSGIVWFGETPILTTNSAWIITYKQIYNGSTYEIWGAANKNL